MYRAAIIGLGDIGWKFDDRITDGKLTHKSAYQTHPETKLACGYDPCAKARHDFSLHTGTKVVDNLNDLLATKPDVVSITSPTHLHAQHLTACLHAKVPMVWLEKPAAQSSIELQEAIKLQHQYQSTTVMVGFQRRYVPVYRRLRDVIEHQQLGRCVCLSIVYSRGLLTNGIHMIDLLPFIADVDANAAIVKLGDVGSDDNPSFLLKSSALECTVTGIDLDYHSIDLTAHFENGRIQILHGGLTEIVESKVANCLYPGFFHLAAQTDTCQARQQLEAETAGVMPVLLADLIESHKQQKLPQSNLQTSLIAQKIVERVLSSC